MTLSHHNHRVSVSANPKTANIAGRADTCAICGSRLEHDTNRDGYRVESCPVGCPSQDLAYQEEFRIR